MAVPPLKHFALNVYYRILTSVPETTFILHLRLLAEDSVVVRLQLKLSVLFIFIAAQPQQVSYVFNGVSLQRVDLVPTVIHDYYVISNLQLVR